MKIRYAIDVLLVFLLIVSLFFLREAYCDKKWEVATASLSLIIAIISAWIASETFAALAEANAPQLLLAFDSTSRYDLLQLKIQNYGSKPAFDIKITWDRPIIDFNEKPVKFNSATNVIDVKVLNGADCLYALVNGLSAYYKSISDGNYEYTGVIEYKTSLSNWYTRKVKFIISAEAFENGLTYEVERPKTEFELQKLPKELQKISDQLALFNKILKDYLPKKG